MLPHPWAGMHKDMYVCMHVLTKTLGMQGYFSRPCCLVAVKWNCVATIFLYKESSVLDPDPNPDPHVFGPPGSKSGSTSQRNESGSFYHEAKIVRKTLLPIVL
jgi:hypothetical protein